MTLMSPQSKLIWLGHLISDVQKNEIDSVRDIAKTHNKFWLPETIMGERGFKELKTVNEQAFCQVLCHEGCIVSGLLFGFSLSNYYLPTKRVLLEAGAIDYCFVCLDLFLLHHRERGFAEAAEYLGETDVLYQICQFLLENRHHLNEQLQSHAVFEFCYALTSNVHHHIRH